MNSRLQPLSSAEFQEIYSRVPRLCVEVIVQTDRGIVLVQRQEESWKGQWHIPGGTVLYKETLAAAVQRLAEEELGIAVRTDKLVGYIEYPSEERERGFGWSVGIAFLCAPQSGIDWEKWNTNHIKPFTELPDNLIAEQRKILESLTSNTTHP